MKKLIECTINRDGERLEFRLVQQYDGGYLIQIKGIAWWTVGVRFDCYSTFEAGQKFFTAIANQGAVLLLS